MTRLNPQWIDNMEIKVMQSLPIDETLSFNRASQWLVQRLASLGVPFKIFNLGAGVKRITTNTDTCPCCKKKL